METGWLYSYSSNIQPKPIYSDFIINFSVNADI